MVNLYLLRHAESQANIENILAGQMDYPLSEKGKSNALELAQRFAERITIDALWCSPLLRAQQTAAPFVLRCNIPLRLDRRIMEQHLGLFSGMTYAEAEAHPGYRKDRSARWHWVPEAGGESYEMVAARIQSFLGHLRRVCRQEGISRVLVVTHAVTLRLLRAELEQTLPDYPEEIAKNGELWISELAPKGRAVGVESSFLVDSQVAHRA
jgi:broad specificity phosphatase PhoE